MKWSNYSETRYSNQMRIENQQNNSCLKKTRCVLTPQMPRRGPKFKCKFSIRIDWLQNKLKIPENCSFSSSRAYLCQKSSDWTQVPIWPLFSNELTLHEHQLHIFVTSKLKFKDGNYKNFPFVPKFKWHNLVKHNRTEIKIWSVFSCK